MSTGADTTQEVEGGGARDGAAWAVWGNPWDWGWRDCQSCLLLRVCVCVRVRLSVWHCDRKAMAGMLCPQGKADGRALNQALGGYCCSPFWTDPGVHPHLQVLSGRPPLMGLCTARPDVCLCACACACACVCVRARVCVCVCVCVCCVPFAPDIRGRPPREQLVCGAVRRVTSGRGAGQGQYPIPTNNNDHTTPHHMTRQRAPAPSHTQTLRKCQSEMTSL